MASAPRAARRARRETVERAGHRIGVLEWPGRGTPLVLMHGAGMCAGVFEPVIDHLGDARVVALDLRGHGHSDGADDDAGYALADQAADLFEVLDALDVDEVVAFGHSFGGAVLWRAALEDPARFRALAVHEPAIGDPTDPPEVVRRRAAAFTRRVGARTAQWASTRAMVADLAAVPSMREIDPCFLEALAGHGTVPCPAGVAARCTPEVEAAMFRVTLTEHGGNGLHDRLAALGALALPLTLLVGRDSEKRVRLFEEVSRRSSIPVTLVDGYHFAPFRSPSVLAGLLERHVLAHRRSTS